MFHKGCEDLLGINKLKQRDAAATIVLTIKMIPITRE